MTLSQDELKSTESGYTINRSNDTLESSTEIVTKYDGTSVGGIGGGGGGSGVGSGGSIGGGGVTVNGTATTNKINHSGANGSVITMTLKNNHLIVETEERNDISRDARETKMHYTPSEKDGVFVVEVARGVDSQGIPESPHKDPECRQNSCTLDIDTIDKTKMNDIKAANHEEVQIHQPPSHRVSDNDILFEVDESNISPKSEICDNLRNCNTGLSQSDLSTSSADSNRGYTYGNQQPYTVESDESRPHSPIIKASPVPSPNKCENGDCPSDESAAGKNNLKLDFETKPIITAALLKHDTVIEISEKSTKNLNSESKTEENGNPRDNENASEKLHQEQQHKLGNGKISSAIVADNGQTTNNQTENGFDSIISLPAPPSTEEIKQMNDIISMENTQLDSLPPPPPPDNQNPTTITLHDVNISGLTGEGQQNGVVAVTVTSSS